MSSSNNDPDKNISGKTPITPRAPPITPRVPPITPRAKSASLKKKGDTASTSSSSNITSGVNSAASSAKTTRSGGSTANTATNNGPSSSAASKSKSMVTQILDSGTTTPAAVAAASTPENPNKLPSPGLIHRKNASGEDKGKGIASTSSPGSSRKQKLPTGNKEDKKTDEKAQLVSSGKIGVATEKEDQQKSGVSSEKNKTTVNDGKTNTLPDNTSSTDNKGKFTSSEKRNISRDRLVSDEKKKVGGGDDKKKVVPEEKRRGEVSTYESAIPHIEKMTMIQMGMKGEWATLEQILRNADKEKPPAGINGCDEDTGVTLLMLAARDGRIVIAERILELGANVNDIANDGRTALHYASAYAKDDTVRLLLNRKADPNIIGGVKNQLALHMACSRSLGVMNVVNLLLKFAERTSRLTEDKDGLIPLFHGTLSGNTAVCRELLSILCEQQIKTQRRDTKDTVLHIACRKKDHDQTRLFIEHAADVNLQNQDGQTPLHISAREGDDILVKYLHSMKANANITDKLDRTPLHIAAERGHTHIVEVLVDKYKANISARTKDGSTLIHIASQNGHPETALAFLKKGVPLHMPNKGGEICLHAAAQKGHVAVIKALIQKGAPIDARTKDNYTALHVAVEHCKPQAIQTLLGNGAQVEIKGGPNKETPLHIAARIKEGDRCAEMLMKSGANVNSTQENGETALHISSRFGQLKMVNALLTEGADPTWQSKNGETAVHVATRYCHLEVVKALLDWIEENKSHLDVLCIVNLQNEEGETPVHYAAEVKKKQAHREFEDTDLMKLMLKFDGDTNIATKLTQETPIHYCARSGNDDILLEIVNHIGPNKTQSAVNKQAKNGWSPLLVASEQGHKEILQILLKHNARVDVFDEHGKAALHLAAENGHCEVADLLLLQKAFVNAKSKLGVTPLHLASQNGFNHLVKLLIEKHGATIDALSLAKKTPLHMAAQNGQIEVCSTLLKIKADANATDVHGQTPLHLAAENDHSTVVKLFLKHRPELVGMANTNGMTCAHIAASKGSVAVMRELMRFNKSVVTTARNKTNGSTALHLAAGGGYSEVAQVLLDAGADIADENGEGLTAIHLAAQYGHMNILECLKDKSSFKVTSTKTGFGALHVAAHYGQIDFVREILSQVPATITSEPPKGYDNGTGGEYAYTPLHLAAQSGHEGLVRLLLNSPGVQVDAPTAIVGSIPLHLAAQSGHTAVVSLLLSKSTNQIHCKDKRGRTGLHLAASSGHLDMISLLLGQGADINCYDQNGWTPLHFAAKAGHLKVVKLLVESGALPKNETKDSKVAVQFAAANSHAEVLSFLIRKEHDTHKLMDDKKYVFDLMILGKTNNDKSIEEFVLVSPAPVETAVKLSQNFRSLAMKEKERAKDLLLAGDFCENMATELNAMAAGLNGAAVLLKSVDNRGMPFLDVLIECEQKQVVSHPAVQKYLSEVWMGHLSHWAGWKMIVLFAAMIFIPPVWLAFSLPFKHKFNRVPVIKFMAYLVSHIYLIGWYVLTIVIPLVPIWESSNLIPHWYEWMLLAWLSGLVVSQLTNPQDRAGLGWIKVIVLAISAIGVIIHLIAFAFQEYNRLLCLYIRNQFFGFSLLLCFVQVLDFLSFHHLFGPWAIIIRDLLKDLTRFLVILSIFVVGFTLHLAAIYQPVIAPLEDNSDLGDGNGSGNAKVETPLDTLELLFFALFGLVEPENLPPVHRNPVWTLTLVKAVFGIYLVVTLIVLINLLIAMMSDTYQRIQAQSDIEWKFGRAKLFRNMNKTSATPSPLNLITKLFIYCKILYKHKGKVCSMNAQHFIDEEEDLDNDSDNRSVDLHHHSGGGLFNKIMRRNTQVSPGDSYRQEKPHGPIQIEDVVKWQVVVERYLKMSGVENNDSFNRENQLAEAHSISPPRMDYRNGKAVSDIAVIEKDA